jgi:RNA polymerase sigma factor (sigma-70 family)
MKERSQGAMTETTLSRAQGGDGEAFRELIDLYRRELQVHCYRILASAQDAEDVLQEVLLSAWRSIGSFDGGSIRAWLYRIATNRCLNHLRDESRRPQPSGALPFATAAEPVPAEDPSWLEPYPDRWVDDIALGPEARYELRDVLGFPAAEAAEMLGTTPASVNSALLRARGSFRPAEGLDLVPLPRTGEERSLVDRFVKAFESADIDQVVALLTDDVRLAMPPEPIEFRGLPAVGEFFRSFLSWGQQVKLVPTRANCQPAFGYYLWDASTSAFRANGLLVVAMREDRVSSITRFGGAGVIARFDLPAVIDL